MEIELQTLVARTSAVQTPRDPMAIRASFMRATARAASLAAGLVRGAAAIRLNPIVLPPAVLV